MDDYPDAADALCSLMTKLGHECHKARNGREALEEARRIDPDIAIIDIAFPISAATRSRAPCARAHRIARCISPR